MLVRLINLLFYRGIITEREKDYVYGLIPEIESEATNEQTD